MSLLREYIARKIDLVTHRYLELCEPIENGVLRWLHPERTLEVRVVVALAPMGFGHIYGFVAVDPGCGRNEH